MQPVVPQRHLPLQRLFLPHDEVDDVVLQLALHADLLEPLGLIHGGRYLVPLHEELEVGLFFLGQVGDVVGCRYEFQLSGIYRLHQRRNQVCQADIPLDLCFTVRHLLSKHLICTHSA